jgi:hypothetical protein
METSTRELVFISAAPNDRYFLWQYRVLLHNFRKYGLSYRTQILIWKHNRRAGNEAFEDEWKVLEEDYPEAKIFYYEDETGELHNLIGKVGYIPLLRPWLLSKHFKEYPELEKMSIFYHDSDIVFTKSPDFSRLLIDDVNYLSDTRSYIAASYFDSKVKDVKADKLEEYQKIDALQEVLNSFGLTREIAEKNENGSGGAQYLLKNISASFWEKVFKGCIDVRNTMGLLNRKYFESEDKGFQRWAADMWSVLFTLWANGYETACPKEMNFAWATDKIEKWDQVQIYHDAGATSRNHDNAVLFHKREAKYINNQGTPFEDDLSDVSKDYCSSNYVREIEEAGRARHFNIEGIKPFSMIENK